MRARRLVAVLSGLALTVLLTVGLVAPTPATAETRVVTQGGADVDVKFVARTPGEAVLDLRAAAPGTDWAVPDAESAVLSVSVDGRYATDVVVSGDAPLDQQVALGALTRGRHVLTLHFAADRSAPAATRVELSRLHVTMYGRADPAYLALRYAPVVYGRVLPDLGDPYQNAVTDTPLIAWHEAQPSTTPGHTRLVYSVVWSNEDGGTNSPALMARWGRTTDIEWVYAVDVDANGERVPGSDVYQAPDHQTLPFQGGYEGDHALLQTCTSNNNMCDTIEAPGGRENAMRFFPSTLQTLPAGQAREYRMDVNPWTYRVMAKEMLREDKIEPPSPDTPATPEVSDQRNYLYAVVKKATEGEQGDSWVGLALGVRLDSGDTVYLSHHTDPTWSIARDDPAATTVELPAGTTADDIAEITAHRIVVGTDTGAPVRVTALQRGFLLDADYAPQESFLSWAGDVTVTAEEPAAVLWTRSAAEQT